MGRITETFRNPVSRARAYIWTGVAVVCFGVFFFVMVGATSSYWFCAEVCHAVQDDSIYSYQNSAHRTVSCLACHMPAGADPVTFLLHKATALAEVPMTLMGTYEIPLNKGSHLATNPDHMGSKQCTQCHVPAKRNITPSSGMVIDHQVHEDANISCTFCHNRIAHNETDRDFEFRNVDPNTGELNTGHPNFSDMNGCFRCHRLPEDGIVAETPFDAPGGCEACHTSEFDLVPGSHKEGDWRGAHGEAAKEQAAHVAEVEAELSHEEGHGAEPKSDEAKATAEVPNVGLVNECYTCHEPSYCTDCHGGVEMPHAGDFGTTHAEAAKANTAACITCHGERSCDSCHHADPNVPGYTLDLSQTWQNQHNEGALKGGYTTCLRCHEDPTYCEACHVQQRVRR